MLFIASFCKNVFPLFFYASSQSAPEDSWQTSSLPTCSHMKAVMLLTFLWMTQTWKWERNCEWGWTAPRPTAPLSQQLRQIRLQQSMAVLHLHDEHAWTRREQGGPGWQYKAWYLAWLHIVNRKVTTFVLQHFFPPVFCQGSHRRIVDNKKWTERII